MILLIVGLAAIVLVLWLRLYRLEQRIDRLAKRPLSEVDFG